MVRALLFLLVVWLATPAAMASTPRALAAWDAGDYYRAFAEAIEPANDGDHRAEYLIAEAYRLGKGVVSDQLSAERWYYRAASGGHVAAAAELGAIYAGDGRIAEARRWLRFAAERGDAGAAGTLAALYFNGADGHRDVPEALALMARAAAGGSPQAKVQLARMRNIVGDQAAAVLPAVITTSQPRASPVVATPRTGPMWRVQVGAFGTKASAARAWKILTHRVRSLSGADHALIPHGTMVQLQTGASSQRAANAHCRTISVANWKCLVRPPLPRAGRHTS
jgi:hypothetical protein